VANETADQLAAILLSARPPEVGEQMRRPAIPVREAVVGLDKQSGAHVLELQLAGDIAIHFLLSKPLVRQLAKKLVDPRWKMRATTKYNWPSIDPRKHGKPCPRHPVHAAHHSCIGAGTGEIRLSSAQTCVTFNASEKNSAPLEVLTALSRIGVTRAAIGWARVTRVTFMERSPHAPHYLPATPAHTVLYEIVPTRSVEWRIFR